MSSLRNRFIFPFDYWSGATFPQKRLNEGDTQVIFKRMRASGNKFTQKVIVKSYDERAIATPAQETSRSRFSTAWANTSTILASDTDRAAAQLEFEKQYRYSTLRGYVFAREYRKLLESTNP